MEKDLKPDWRDIGTDEVKPSVGKPWQPDGTAASGTFGLPTRRRIKRIIGLVSLIALAVSIGFVLHWLRPIRPACLVLIGSGYETNLLFPNNVYGWSGLLAMDQEVADDEDLFKSLSRFSLTQPTKMRRVGLAPVELKEKSWDEMWNEIPITSERTLVVCISLHGFADEKDAFLLPNFTVHQPKDFDRSLVSFRKVLDSLKTVKNENILLILDVSAADVHWPIGMLQNNFVERLQEKYGDEIKSNEKLAVICSCSPEQCSWGSDELQSSVFTHFVIEGLKGAGHDRQTNVTAQSLFDHVKASVDTWAQANRARNQTPILLAAETRAMKIDLVHIANTHEKKSLPPTPLNLEALKTEWTRWKELKSGQAAFVNSPHIWRLYQDNLLRFEQLQRAGDPTRKAHEVKKTLDTLYNYLTTKRSLAGSYACLGNNFSMYRVLGYTPPVDLRDSKLQEYLSSLRKFDNAKPEELAEKTKLLSRFRENSQMEKQYLRTRFNQMILRDMQGPLDWQRERERMAEIDNELAAPQRPAETQLLRMLQEADPNLGIATIKLAVEVRALAEDAALSVPSTDSNSELYAETIFPWIQNALTDADKVRRDGEDLLFGDPATHGITGHKKLTEAKKAYELVRIRAEALQRALVVRDVVSSEFPYLAAWLASVTVSDPDKAELDALRLAGHEISISLSELNRALDAKDRMTLPPVELVDQIRTKASSIRKQYQATAEKLRTLARQQKNWHAINVALSVPPAGIKEGDEIKLRVDLLRKQREISTALLENSNPEGQTEAEESFEIRLKRQRYLLHASLRSIVEIRTLDSDSIDESARNFLLRLPIDIVDKAEEAEEVTPNLIAAANKCRAIPGAYVDQVRDALNNRVDAIDRLRRLRLGDLFCRLAERTLEDHWFEPNLKREERYYESAGESFLAGARGLFGSRPTPESLLEKLGTLKARFLPRKLRLGKLDKLHWTTESDFLLRYRLQADEKLPLGTPMVWLEVTKGKMTEKVWPRIAMNTWPKFDDAFVLDKTNFSGKEDATVKVHAIYRGQHVIESSYTVRSQANAIVCNFPSPTESSFAVRMESTFDYGAISIVLDNSGSMKFRYPKQGEKHAFADKKANERRRFDFALDALGHVLKKVPDNTLVSLYGLGSGNGADFKTGATLFRSPTPWQQKGELDKLLSSLDQAPGDIGSPIAETMIKSMEEGFPAGFKGPKVLLVLTDGDDNASFKDETGDRTKRLVDELRRARDLHPGITVVFVCFIDKNVDADEFKSAEAQFKVVDSFSLGSRFLDVPESDKLGIVMEDLIRPRLQVIVDEKTMNHPINFHNDRALNWKTVAPSDCKAAVPSTLSKQQIDLHLLPAQKLFMVLSREDEKLMLRRGLLARQPELEARGALRKEKDGWLVSLMENEIKGLKSSVLKQTIVFEKEEINADRVQQTYPGLVWLELEALNAAKPTSTLVWWNDWNVPAPGFRLEMRDWPTNSIPKLTTWFWRDDRADLLRRKIAVREARPVPFHEPLYGSAVEKPTIESIDWEENREIGTPTGERIKKKCLVVRVRHPAGKPVWVDLERRSPGIGSEHHYFAEAQTCSSYFYGISKLDGGEMKLVLIDLAAFKSAAQNVNFAPDVRIEAPRIFVSEVR